MKVDINEKVNSSKIEQYPCLLRDHKYNNIVLATVDGCIVDLTGKRVGGVTAIDESILENDERFSVFHGSVSLSNIE